MLNNKTTYLVILLLVSCALFVHCELESSVTATESFPDNPEDKHENEPLTLHKRPSFFVGSRYGRSGGASQLYATKARRLNVVPRNDRFFLGSRYGKRSGEFISPYEQNSYAVNEALSSTDFAAANANNNKLLTAGPLMMSCIYTGIKDLYRCNSAEEINNILNQLTSATNNDEQK